MAIRGISLKCPAASISTSMLVSDIDDDIVGTDPALKAAYWIWRTLENVVEIKYPLEDMIENWLRFDSSMYLEFTVDGIGGIRMSKRF